MELEAGAATLQNLADTLFIQMDGGKKKKMSGRGVLTAPVPALGLEEKAVQDGTRLGGA